MKRFVRIIIILTLFYIPASGQHFEVGLMGGISNYLGDLSPRANRVSIGKTHLMGGAFVRYSFNDFITAKLGVNYGNVSAFDAISDIEFQQTRNLSFESHILEGSLTAEFNILGYQPYNLYRPFSPYIFAGIGFFNFNPKANLNGEWYELQPLHTEGQSLSEFPDRKPYKLNEISIPFGVGVKYAINDKLNVGLELGVRKTFTDYLDDVSMTYIDDSVLAENFGEISAALANRTGAPVETGSPRGNDENDDWYFMAGVTVSYNFLDNGLVGNRGRSKRKQGCNF